MKISGPDDVLLLARGKPRTIGALLSTLASMFFKKTNFSGARLIEIPQYSHYCTQQTSYSHPTSYPDSHNQSRGRPRHYQELNEGFPSLFIWSPR